MEKRAEKLITNLEEKLKFFSEIGIEFLSSSSSKTKDSRFLTLEERILNCQQCALSQGRTNAVPGEGILETELMFVGEAPGCEEDIKGRPFVGRAGQLLTRIINAMQFNREDVYITNVVKCRPPKNRNPNKEEVETCKSYLLEQIEMIKPRVIVALGKVATDFFVHSSLGMTALRGKFYEFHGIQMMPTFHPSYLIRNEGNKSIKKMVWEDMKKVMFLLGKK